ncbi:MAG: response regulator [Alphaproteobacteria bacterium]|nr:response regulator [Alphaproteobacteria bacterium]
MDVNWFTSTVLSSIDGFFDWNLVSGKLSLSSTFKHLLGYTKEEINGDNKHFFHENLHPDDKDKILNNFSTFFSGHRERIAQECRLKTKKGDFIWVRIQGKIFRDAQSKAIRFSSIVIDVDEIRQSVTHPAENSEEKAKLFAMLNHELRSPLAAIISTAQLTCEEPLTEKQARYMHNIIQSADLLLKLVNDILDASKIDAGKLFIEYQPFAFEHIIDNTLQMMKPACEQKGLYFNASIDPAIPFHIISDSTRLQQIILNFVSNAVKFTQTGGITLNVRYTPIREHKGKLYIEVVDTGIGIPSNKINMLFKEFSQADISTTRIYGGTGLGLAICKKLVGLMGGEIAVRSREGKGSTFWFEITVDIPRASITQNSLSSSEIKVITTPLNSLNILVAEDNMVNQEVMMGLLERLNHKVTIAENGQVAVDLMRKNTFDLILMDINMPQKDGIEACREIRTFNKNIPIIAVTANGLDSEKEKCLAAGMNDFATKPVDKSKLTEILKPFQYGDNIVLTQRESYPPEKKESKMSSEIYLNHDHLKQLIVDLGAPKMKKLIELYKQDAPGLIENLEKKIDAERSAHTLAGMSENLNFTALAKRSRTILQLVREEGGENQIHAIVSELPTLYTETIKAATLLVS